MNNKANKGKKWNELKTNNAGEFHMMFYNTLRQIKRLERKINQMAVTYKTLEEKSLKAPKN